MLIRPTSIIAHSLIETDLRQFTHTLNQEQITDTDSIIPITHKGQLTQINRKDLSNGMSPWSAYHRDWLTNFTLDLDYLCQGITWYREVDDDIGIMRSYWFKGKQEQLEYYNDLLSHFETGLRCEIAGRYLIIVRQKTIQGEDINKNTDCRVAPRCSVARNDDAVNKILSRFLGLLLVYGTIQQSNGVCTTLKINLPITGYIRSQITLLQEDYTLLRSHGLFVHWYLIGNGMKQNVELVTNDAELIQLLLSHLQYIDSDITMTTFDTLQSRSQQVCALGLNNQGFIAKPRTLA